MLQAEQIHKIHLKWSLCVDQLVTTVVFFMAKAPKAPKAPKMSVAALKTKSQLKKTRNHVDHLSIRVSQMECHSISNPPAGCLQYFTGLTGK